MKIYNLNATLQKSYYGKAKVIETDNKVQLQSYQTIVCEIDKDNNFIRLWNGYSVTTMKHINDFRMAFGFDSLSKKEWLALPCINNEQYQVKFSNGFVNWKSSIIFDKEEDAYNFADDVCEKHDWHFGASIESI